MSLVVFFLLFLIIVHVLGHCYSFILFLVIVHVFLMSTFTLPFEPTWISLENISWPAYYYVLIDCKFDSYINFGAVRI